MIHMYLLLFLVSPTCPLLWSNQSQALALHGQALSMTSPCAHFLVYHSYLTCLYFTFCPEEHCQRRATHLPIPVSLRIEIQHLCLAPSHTYFALLRIVLHCHNPTVSTCHNTPGDNPLPPDCTPSEPHRIYTQIFVVSQAYHCYQVVLGLLDVQIDLGDQVSNLRTHGANVRTQGRKDDRGNNARGAAKMKLKI